MSLGIWEILLLLVVVLIFFGAGKLPRVMRDFGQGLRALKSGLDGKEEVPSPAPEAKAEAKPLSSTSPPIEPKS